MVGGNSTLWFGMQLIVCTGIMGTVVLSPLRLNEFACHCLELLDLGKGLVRGVVEASIQEHRQGPE